MPTRMSLIASGVRMIVALWVAALVGCAPTIAPPAATPATAVTPAAAATIQPPATAAGSPAVA